MTEIKVGQRTTEWFELRQCMVVTASQFGEAIGVGKGKPYHFLASLVERDSDSSSRDSPNPYMEHGNIYEPIINEAYELLMRHPTESSGFWTPAKGDILENLVGASPDGKVISVGQGGRCLGLVEFKAPVHQMYKCGPLTPHGVPRQYMAQVQGQMGVCGLPWCDFMALCVATRQILLKRVYFQPDYWRHMSLKLKEFCLIFKEASSRKASGQDPLDFTGAAVLQKAGTSTGFLPGEQNIRVENLLAINKCGHYRTKFSSWMSFEFLLGVPDPEVPLSKPLSDKQWEALDAQLAKRIEI